MNTTPITGPAETSVGGSQIDNPYIQGVIGTGMNWGGAVVGFFKGIFDFEIDIFDDFDIIDDNSHTKALLETLINTLKPAVSRAFINYVK